MQHRGVDGASVAEEDDDDAAAGKEHMPNGILARLKSDSGGISIQDFIIIIDCFDVFFCMIVVMSIILR